MAGSSDSREKPLYGPEYRRRITDNKLPQVSASESLKARSKLFCEEVVIIIQTVNEDEKWAVLDFMKPPTNFTWKVNPLNKTVDLDDIVLGMFGGYASALIQTKMGRDCRQEINRALDKLPHAKFVLAIGMAFAFNQEKCKYGDVLVSEIIKAVSNQKIDKNGDIIYRESGNRTHNLPKLLHVFARGAATWNDFKCTKEDGAPGCTENSGRYSKVHTGVIISTETLIDNETARDKLLKFSPEAIGGEMEGATLVEVQYDLAQKEPMSRELGIIIIKGVADYANGFKDKSWQLTSAMAAAHYADHKLIETSGSLFSVKDKSTVSATDEISKLVSAVDDRILSDKSTVSATDEISKLVSAVDDRILSDSNCLRVNEAIISVNDWHSLGLALGIERHWLERIKTDHRTVMECQRAMISQWLDNGDASWRALVRALSSQTIGKKGLAKKIALQYSKL